MKNSAAPKPTIKVRLYGGDALPENVTIQYLAELTKAVQSLCQSKLYLMKVKRTSATYAFAPANTTVALASLKRSESALETPEHSLESRMLASFDIFAEIANHFKCNLEIGSLVEGDDWLWKFGISEWEGLRQRLFMKDEGTITGIRVRVGGATERKCGIQVPNLPRMMICTLRDEGLARRLGEHLYKEMTLRGTGMFFTRDFSMHSFKVEDFTLVKRGTFEELNQAIRAAGGGWDSVADPLQEIEGMR
jgi:hypothetical protein